MKKRLQILVLSVLTLISATAFAQPVPPFTIYLSGQLQNCSPSGSTINVQINPNSINFVNMDISVDANCSYADSVLVQDIQGMITITFPCNGMLESVMLSYGIGFLGNTSVFTVLNCNSTNVDCLGVVGGSALPGTACDDSDPNTVNDTWNSDCNCIGNANTLVDCLGVVNGPAQPGTSCDDNDPNTVNDMWTADCTCSGQAINPGDCAASFWVLQGYNFGPGQDPNTVDSTVVLPIPNELWVWNLSTSSSNNMSFVWDFGDESTSTDAYPTHIYDGTGPYELCLTITDGSGCSDTYCETISVDPDGIIVGVAGDSQNDNRSVLTLNVQEEQPVSVNTAQLNGAITLWPNPVQNSINLSISSRTNDKVVMSITDMNGRAVAQSKNTLRSGTNQLQMDVTDLNSGMYILQIGNGVQTTTRRFVKQ